MTSKTAEVLVAHHDQCGEYQFGRSSSLLVPTDTVETITYHCRRCGFEVKEGPGSTEGQQPLPLQEKAA